MTYAKPHTILTSIKTPKCNILTKRKCDNTTNQNSAAKMQQSEIERKKNENAQTRKGFTWWCLCVFALLHFDGKKEELNN
jgi:hypothetical protein